MDLTDLTDLTDPELIHGTLENIYTTVSVYQQKQREYRLAAKADRGHFYTNDKERYEREAEKYGKLIADLEKQKSEIITEIIAKCS
jgi:hypothetical protein